MPVRTGKSGGNRETRLKTIKILGKYCLKNQRDETIQAFYLVAKTPRRFSDFCCFFYNFYVNCYGSSSKNFRLF